MHFFMFLKVAAELFSPTMITLMRLEIVLLAEKGIFNSYRCCDEWRREFREGKKNSIHSKSGILTNEKWCS